MFWHFKTEVNENVIDAERKSHMIREREKKSKNNNKRLFNTVKHEWRQ